jgi:hypothetical protein
MLIHVDTNMTNIFITQNTFNTTLIKIKSFAEVVWCFLLLVVGRYVSIII